MWWKNYSQTLSWKIKSQEYLWINSLKFYTVCFYCKPSWGLLKYIETKLQTNCLYLILIFVQNKNKSGNTPRPPPPTCPCFIFCIVLEEKYFSWYILLIGQVSLPCFLYFVKYWATFLLQLFLKQIMTSWILKLT